MRVPGGTLIVGILGSIFGGSKRSTLQATIDAQKSALATMVRAKYDAAQTSDLNRNHWARADHLSADAALQPAVRQTLRNRARYELRNNSYAAGIASTWSNDLVGTGPRLQLDLGPDVSPEAVRSIEHAVSDWAEAIDLGRKLRIAKTSKISDGEVFGLKTNNRRLRGVQLDLKLVEADQVMSPASTAPSRTLTAFGSTAMATSPTTGFPSGIRVRSRKRFSSTATGSTLTTSATGFTRPARASIAACRRLPPPWSCSPSCDATPWRW